jgi:PAS domain S-box-containing protein
MRQRANIDGREALSDVARQQLQSYGVILGVFLFLLVVALATSWGAIKMVDSTRAYVTGEGRYSKAEKIAVLSLHRYAYSALPEDYAHFLAAVTVPLGDHAARLALQSNPVDLKAARQGFLQGENHPADISSMTELFRLFSWWHPFAAAVGDWQEGDRLVAALAAEGKELHWMITRHSRNKGARARLLDRVDRIDDQLTLLENRFSAHLGDAARTAARLIVFCLSVMTVLLWAMGTILATRLVKRQLALGGRLETSEGRFRDFADIASDWYWEMDADGIVTYVSERFASIVGGAPAQNVLGFDADKFVRESAVSPEDRETYLNAVLNQREFRGIRLALEDRASATRYWSISARPNRDAQGVFLGYRGVGTDITDAVHDEFILRDAKLRAEIANRAKSEFLANMSHELRTPLNAILGFSDMIAEQSLGPDAVNRYSEYAVDIHKSGRHLLAIIDDILDLAKIEAGHTELVESEVPLVRLMEMFRTFLGHRFLECGIAFAIDIPHDAPSIWIDKRKLAQVIINLLSNALKFTQRGGRVVLSSRGNADGSLAISVRDTGIGIAPEDMQMVLSPFGQVESAFSRKHHGAGLGLPLARSLTELHGGTLTIDSELGTGTTVTVTLPATRVTPAPAVDDIEPRQALAR